MNNDLAILFRKQKDLGLTIRELSNLLQIPETRVYNWKNERGQPKADDLLRIREWLRGFDTSTPVAIAADRASADLLELKSLLDAVLAHYCDHLGELENRPAIDVQKEIMMKAMRNMNENK